MEGAYRVRDVSFRRSDQPRYRWIVVGAETGWRGWYECGVEREQSRRGHAQSMVLQRATIEYDISCWSSAQGTGRRSIIAYDGSTRHRAAEFSVCGQVWCVRARGRRL